MDSADWKGELVNYEQHPLGAVFPSMSSLEFAELRSDIRKYGLRQAITLFEGKVLDGWHRCRACSETGTPLRTEEFKGDDNAALAFVLSANVNRRHLTTSDRSLIGARLATLKRGRRQMTQMGHLPIADIAEHLKVSKNSVQRAKTVLEHGDPELIARVQRMS